MNKEKNIFESEYIKVAQTAGFCYGVKRAVDETFNLVKKGEKIVTLGNLIHNNQVIKNLSDMGVKSYENVSDIPDGSLVVIRAHGVSKKIIEELEARNLKYGFNLSVCQKNS